MALIATQVLSVSSGAAPSFAAAAAGDTANVGETNTLIVKNGSASAVTVTITRPGLDPLGDAWSNKTYSVAAGGERWIPLVAAFADPAQNGQASISYSATASVTRAVVQR